MHRAAGSADGREHRPHRAYSAAAQRIRPDREAPGDGQQAEYLVEFVIGQRPVARRDGTEYLRVQLDLVECHSVVDA